MAAPREHAYNGMRLCDAVAEIAAHHIHPDVRHINHIEVLILERAAAWMEANGCAELVSPPQPPLFSADYDLEPSS